MVQVKLDHDCDSDCDTCHRAEVIDDHASDSNHKKALGIGNSALLLSPGLLIYLVFVALVLCDRFGHAKDMVHKTSAYYAQFESTISPGALKKWTKEITSAESRRMKNPRVMDIIGAHLHQNNADPAQSESITNCYAGVGTEWLDLAFSIEERQ